MSPPAPNSAEPSVAGLRVRPALPLLLYGMLVASAGLALWSQRAPEAPTAMATAAPWVFLAFVVGFAAYRLSLVIAKRYSAYKAFVQVMIAALFYILLAGPMVPGAPVPTLGQQLVSHDAQVRALAAEVAGYRADRAAAPRLVELLEDGAPAVRTAAHDALVRLNGGRDLGGPEASTAWRAQFP